MYVEQLGEGENYSKLGRTVCINILNFKYLKTEKFHTGYRLKEIESNEELTDIIYTIDVVDFYRTSKDELKNNIIKQGIVIFDKNIKAEKY